MIGRIVCHGGVPGHDHKAARKAITSSVSALKTPVVMTPGGFVHFDMDYNGTKGWHAESADFYDVAEAARKFMESKLLTPGTKSKIEAHSLTVTIGIDAFCNGKKIAELVLVRSKDGTHPTGKSFPRTDEENELVLAPVGTHYIRVNGVKTVVLGCHDLNVWSGRSAANTSTTSNRYHRRMHMKERAVGWKPQMVLHHPHATDTDKTWAAGWGGVKRELAPLRYASGLGYYNEYGRKVQGFRQPLDKVRAAHNSGPIDNVIEFN